MGKPVKIADAPAEEVVSPVEEVRPAQAIQDFAWADEGAFVCIYIDIEQEPEAIKAAGDGKAGQVHVDFQKRSFTLLIVGASTNFALIKSELHAEIVPELGGREGWASPCGLPEEIFHTTDR